MDAEIRKMEEDRLPLEEIIVVGWRPPTIRELAPMPEDQEIVSFTDFHQLGLAFPCTASRVASCTSTASVSMT